MQQLITFGHIYWADNKENKFLSVRRPRPASQQYELVICNKLSVHGERRTSAVAGVLAHGRNWFLAAGCKGSEQGIITRHALGRSTFNKLTETLTVANFTHLQRLGPKS